MVCRIRVETIKRQNNIERTRPQRGVRVDIYHQEGEKGRQRIGSVKGIYFITAKKVLGSSYWMDGWRKIAIRSLKTSITLNRYFNM
jgi:hypothetical protein